MDPLGFIGGLFGAAANIFGGDQNRKAADALNRENINNQDFLAENRIQLTTADAIKAGINPLAALGNATQSYTNVTGDTGPGDSFSKAGHDIGRAIAAQSPEAARARELENKLLEAKIANTNADTVSTLKTSSDQATKLGQPGTPPGPVDYRFPSGPPLPTPGLARTSGPMVTSRGDVVDVPTQEFAQRTQTTGALPVNIMQGVYSVGNMLNDAMNYIPGQLGIRGDVFRSAVPNRGPLGDSDYSSYP